MLNLGRSTFDVPPNHLVHVDVMVFRERVGNELVGKADADFGCIRPGEREGAVIESASTAEASAARIEGQAGTEEGVDEAVGNDRQGGGGLENAEGSGNEIALGIAYEVEGQVVAADAGVEPVTVGEAVGEWG